MKIELLREVDSTNTYIRKYLGGGEDVIVCAERQTGGKGTKGRTFSSKDGGVYLSKLTFYENMPASEAFRVMVNAAVAVCNTACAFGVDPHIKWPNDVLVGKRKLSGTLIENTVTDGVLQSSIAGIGLNVNNDLSDVKEIAVSLSQIAKKPLSVSEVRDCLIGELLKEHTFEEYRSFIRFLGKEVLIVEGVRSYRATALRILNDGRLAVKEGEREKILSSAEIGLKISS